MCAPVLASKPPIKQVTNGLDLSFKRPTGRVKNIPMNPDFEANSGKTTVPNKPNNPSEDSTVIKEPFMCWSFSMSTLIGLNAFYHVRKVNNGGSKKRNYEGEARNLRTVVPL